MVVAMPGGAASKAGHRYEDLWTVMRICELLDGPVRVIRLEPPGEAGSGIEFVVDLDGDVWGEQAKDAASSWTITRLSNERVLDAVKSQIDRGRGFRFVAASAAAEFATLAHRARSSESFDEFTESLQQLRRTHLARVAQAWGVAEEEAWSLLRKVDVKHVPFDALILIVRTTLRRLFVDDPELVIGELRNFCDEQIHRSFTAPQVWAHLESKGLRRQLIVGDVNIIGALRRTLERQRRRVRRSAPPIGFVPHNDIDRLLAKLRNPEGRQVMVVDGRAGVGKSTVVSSVAAALENDGWFVAFARMDSDATTQTSARLGHEMGLAESPSILLQGVAGGMPALLVIDQLDAVSTYSGRMPDNFEAVAEAVSEARGVENVKVLLVVRSVDLEADPRLVSLLRNTERVERHTVDELDVEDVKAFLREHGIHVPTSEATLELLRTPLHFAVFARLADRSRTETYRTVQDLYAEYTNQIRKEVAREVGHLDWNAITAALVTHMSNNEVLTAPAHVLDLFDPLEVDKLVSESVLVKDEMGVAFFHESYFDYLFAKAFVAGGRDLCSFLVGSGQYLFRRAQTRQVLEYLAATDRNRFFETVVDLLTTNGIRSHLRAVAIRVLRQIQPTPDAWQALDSVAWSTSGVGPKLINLLSGARWFDAVDELGLWEAWLADPERVDTAFSQIVSAARERPERVAELVRPYVDSAGWSQRFCALVAWSLSSALVDLTVVLVERGQLDNARGPIAVNSDFWTILRRLLNEDPAGAARIIGAFLNRGLARAHQDGAEDPFESGHLNNNSPSYTTIVEAGSKAPAAFVRHVLPFVIRLAPIGQRGPFPDWWPRGRRWRIRHRSTVYTVADAVFRGTEQALRRLARQQPDACADALRELRYADSYELRFLACRALTVIGDPDGAVQWLVSDRRNLALGWADSRHWASRELVEECSPRCSEDLVEELQSALLDYTPEWEQRGSRGHARHVLMSALDPTRMSRIGRRKLQELERRFATSPPPAPKRLEAQMVRSPIGEDASRHMSDDNWIQALRRHNRDSTTWDLTGPPIGGARELANQSFGPRTKEDPERFARLALRFDSEIPPDAMNEVLQNVEGTLDVDLLTELCEHAHRTYGPKVGRWVCSAIHRAETANPRLVALICTYSQDINPEHEEARTRAGNGQYYLDGDLFLAGSNSTRGEAALAAAEVLFSGNDHLHTLLPVVEALALDEVLAVRVCAANAVLALLNHTTEHALDLAARLFDAPIDVLDARTSEALLMHAVLRDPDRFTPLLVDALMGPAQTAKRAGRIWAVARQQGQLIPGVMPEHVHELPTPGRQGAAQVFAADIAHNLDTLPQVLNDDDPQVREQAALAMRHIEQVTAAPDLDALLESLAQSKAFPDHMDILIRTLTNIPTRLPANTIDICQRAIDTAGADLGNAATANFASGPDLVDIILRLYRQGNTALRTQCLDVIDQLTDLNAYDLEKKLDQDRW